MNLRFLRLPYFFLFLLIFSSSNVFSQCFEIQSILVDACGPLEGRNEMVRFKVGNASLNINDLAVIWPNNSWQGIVQNSTTATVVAQLNADIVAAGGCGQILEPPGGILPANATAILVTSYLMVTNDNSFGPLSENIYMIFQNATTSTGHFANQSILPPNNRTLVMNFVGSCSDTVIYDKSQLIDINGNKAPGDGATVNYTPDGTASYTNNGCKAPVPPFTVDAGPATLTACAGSTITLNGTAVGQQSVAWSSSSGNFSSPTTTATNFTIPAGAGGTTIALTLQATNSCGLLISDVINLSVTTNITPDFATTMNLCSTDTAPTLATTSPNGITGTWNPAVINTTASANYIFTPNAGQCGTTASLAVTINSATIPDFATTLTLCSSDTAPTLALTSPNGITGTWNPAVISTTTSGNYTFTPTAGQCAAATTLAVTITPQTIPDFATILTLCSSDTAPTLALTSPNGITGSWNPAVINTTSGNYTFTPTAGQCATNTTLAVTITPQTIPDFATTLTLCSSDTAPTLALTSPNGITGTWSPNIIDTVTSGNYTFTPTAGQCASATTLAVTITPQTIPDFATALTLCSNDTAPTLALTSPNGITGTWSPNIIDTATSDNYTFTPTTGQCAATVTLAVTITPQTIPDFATNLTLCSSDTAPTLALTSPNGITGTWSPAIISTTTSGNYTFTPTAGQCAATTTLTVTLTPQTIPDFATTLTLCSNDTAPTLALTSPSGITGTWSPSVISITTSGNYTFTPTAGQCASVTTLAVTITPQTIPDFATTLTLCSSDTAPTLALTSPNGITGTWNPAVISTATSGNYTFTPTAGQCAAATTLAVTITPQTIPDFATTLTLCSSDTAPTLALTSPNGITGTWSPNIIDTATSDNYTFTPTTGQCAATVTLAVTITPQTIPDFATNLTLCSSDTAPTLALTSPNGITGTWSPAIISTATSGNYTFTPTAGQCATNTTLAVTITPQIIPDFATNLTLCSSDTAPTLALTSPNGITGTWSPAIISTATSGNYTFTPTAGQCATNTTLAVTITPQIIPDFATTLTLCSSDTVPTLALTSPNEITGTWSPAIITTTTSGNYTFTPTAGQCAATTTLTVILTPQTIPDFATTLTLCSNDTAPSLALTSPNGITGTWSPSVISTTTSGNYTFTPNAGQCAAATTLAVTITPQTIPDFATTLTLCSSDTAPTLALTSPNGITGTWSPNIIDTVTSSNYTFTPTAGQCASATTLAVTITPQTIPDFATALTLCSNDTAPTLALTSPNGITGTWSPAIISTTTSSNYTFKPTAGQCAATVTLAVTITPQTIPDFATTLTLCSSDTAPTLALTSPNGITGTWNPAVISTTSGNYTFTPTAGQCAATTTLAVTVTPAIVPDFPATLNFCNGTPPVLQTTSPNGITGIWTTLTNNNSSYIFTPNPGQCATTATVQINFTSPAYTITKACVNNRYLIKVETTSSSNYSYTWVDDKGNPAGSNNETFDFSQYSENYNGELQFPLQFKVIVNDGSCEVEEVIEISNNLCGVPNAVSPNGDGINDTFDLTDFNVNTIAIYNRWGRKVYDFTGRYDKQWHGQWKEGNMLPTGTYYYIISSENGDQKAGYVFLSY